MISFLHSFNPQPILFSYGFTTVYWYGLFVVLGISAALINTLILAKKYGYKKEFIIDLAFYLIIFGIIGARIYDVFLEFDYYLRHPLDIIKIWQGGLAIHGGILAGLIVVYFFSRKLSGRKKFWRLSALIVPSLALGQAIGRFGNYFNQELFGAPTDLPWGIPIDIMKRPDDYLSFNYFHPTFLYESLACLLIFILLNFFHFLITKKTNKPKEFFFVLISAAYLISYSLLRFGLEFIKIDQTPLVFGWRWPQIMSLLITATTLLIIYKNHGQKKEQS